MALPTWPAGVPYMPDANAFSREHHRDALVTETEDGPAIVRVQNQTRIKRMAYELAMTASEFATFENWSEVTIARGTAHFRMQVPLVGATYVERRCYIEGGKWSDTARGADFIVRFTLCAFVAAEPA